MLYYKDVLKISLAHSDWNLKNILTGAFTLQNEGNQKREGKSINKT